MANDKTPPRKRFIKWYGWVPDLPDRRDRLFRVNRGLLINPPRKVDLRPKCPPIQDQGSLGSCTAHAVAGALDYNRTVQTMPVYGPSRLFIYYNTRRIQRTINSDSGATIRDTIKVVARQGAPPETDWPYLIKKFRVRPPEKAFEDALQHQAVVYERVRVEERQVKATLAEGFPIAFGISLYDSFESEAVAKSGIVPYPKSDERQVGGHAMLAVGYDDDTQTIIARNSWSDDWGLQGYCLIPYSYILDPNLADDFWTIKLVE